MVEVWKHSLNLTTQMESSYWNFNKRIKSVWYSFWYEKKSTFVRKVTMLVCSLCKRYMYTSCRHLLCGYLLYCVPTKHLARLPNLLMDLSNIWFVIHCQLEKPSHSLCNTEQHLEVTGFSPIVCTFVEIFLAFQLFTCEVVTMKTHDHFSSRYMLLQFINRHL